MAYIRHPVFGDPVYGGRLQLPPRANDELKGLMRNFGRQALHARRLGLVHPVSERPMQWEAPLPPDMAELIEALRAHAHGGSGGFDDAFYAALSEQGCEIDDDDEEFD
jgi:23S rRNA pseudouridine1911/1915/1917 synthase